MISPASAIAALEPAGIAASPAPDAEPAGQRVCRGCGAAVDARFCGACGEEWTAGRDYSLRRFARESVAAVADLDSTLLRTLAALVGCPGELTAAYFGGARRRYLAPLKVFFVCNVVFFFVQSVTHMSMLSSPLHVYLHYDPFQRVARGIVQHRLAERGTTADAYGAVFDPESVSQAKTLVILMCPMLALPLAALYARSRRYFVEHLVFALHFYAFFLLAIPAFSGIMASLLIGWQLLGGGLPQWANSDSAVGLMMFSLLATYTAVAMRRYYGGGPAAVAVRTLGLVLSMYAVLQAYRFVLFFTVLAVT
jgi:hypothetical protein